MTGPNGAAPVAPVCGTRPASSRRFRLAASGSLAHTIHAGYAGPSVSAGRVFLTDSRRTVGNRAIERALALDEQTGALLWTQEWPADYTGLQLIYAIGPRATPTVDGNRVYVLGAMGRLLALDTSKGNILWQKDFVRDFDASVPSWGMSAAPLVDGDRLIALVGGEPNAKVIAFNKHTGEELWRALSSDWEPGYNQPTIITHAGVRQLIIWHPRAISSLDPVTGKIYWEVPSEVDMGMTVATPVHSGSHLLVTSFYNGARMLKLDNDKPGASMLWAGKSNSEVGHRRHPFDHQHAGDRGQLHLRRRQPRRAALSRARHRQACLGIDGARQGAGAVGDGVSRQERRSLFHQQRSRRAGDCEAVAGGLS